MNENVDNMFSREQEKLQYDNASFWRNDKKDNNFFSFQYLN